VRAVLDPNVLIAAILSKSGAPAQIVSRWLAGDFALVVSDALLAELARALAHPKIRNRVAEDEASAFIELLRQATRSAPDPRRPRLAPPTRATTTSRSPRRSEVSSSPATSTSAPLAGELPILTPRAFVHSLARA
jgi:predicted nucleic acid-binding protein